MHLPDAHRPIPAPGSGGPTPVLSLLALAAGLAAGLFLLAGALAGGAVLSPVLGFALATGVVALCLQRHWRAPASGAMPTR